MKGYYSLATLVGEIFIWIYAPLFLVFRITYEAHMIFIKHSFPGNSIMQYLLLGLCAYFTLAEGSPILDSFGLLDPLLSWKTFGKTILGHMQRCDGKCEPNLKLVTFPIMCWYLLELIASMQPFMAEDSRRISMILLQVLRTATRRIGVVIRSTVYTVIVLVVAIFDVTMWLFRMTLQSKSYHPIIRTLQQLQINCSAAHDVLAHCVKGFGNRILRSLTPTHKVAWALGDYYATLSDLPNVDTGLIDFHTAPTHKQEAPHRCRDLFVGSCTHLEVRPDVRSCNEVRHPQCAESTSQRSGDSKCMSSIQAHFAGETLGQRRRMSCSMARPRSMIHPHTGSATRRVNLWVPNVPLDSNKTETVAVVIVAGYDEANTPRRQHYIIRYEDAQTQTGQEEVNPQPG